MAKKTQPKKPMSKTIALVFVLLMMGSTIGLFVEIILRPSNQVEIPQSRVIKYHLTEAQVKILLANYQTILEYNYPPNCFDCNSFLTSLEQWTMSSDDQIYLQEIQIDGSSSKLTIVSLRGQKTLYDPTKDDARAEICDLLISRSLFCI